MSFRLRTFVSVLTAFEVCLARNLDSELQPVSRRISLYHPGDGIYELFDETIDGSIFGSDGVWIVEFYAHWCGHCQKFVPVWKAVADKFRVWNGSVKIAAMNCGEERACSNFGIVGTPAIRMFSPMTERGGVGLGIPAWSEARSLVIDILRQVQFLQSAGKLGSGKIPILSSLSADDNLIKSTVNRHEGSNITESLVLVLEYDEHDGLGSLIMLHMAARVPELKIAKVSSRNIGDVEVALGLSLDWVELPAMVIITSHGNSGILGSGDRREIEFLPLKLNGPDSTFVPISEVETWITLRLPVKRIEARSKLFTDIDVEEEGESGRVKSIPFDVTDVEKAIKYSLTMEILSKGEFDTEELDTLYLWVHSLLRYVPVRPRIKTFLHSLRSELSLVQQPFSNEDFLRMLRRFDVNGTFAHLPEEWVGCKGSEAQFRGYPCSLWQLFHSMTVTAWTADPFDPNTRISETIIRYVDAFFMCRHCAENFAKEIQDPNLGETPTRLNATVIWLWKVHNIVNLRLKGDETEDPDHPKVYWPAVHQCRDCYSSSNEGKVESVQKVLSYISDFYTPRDSHAGKEQLAELIQTIVDEKSNSSAQGLLNLEDEDVERVKEYCLARGFFLQH